MHTPLNIDFLPFNIISRKNPEIDVHTSFFCMQRVRFHWFIVMSQGESVEEILGEADGLEKKYDWARAAKLCEQALGSTGKGDFSKRGEILDRIGYCLYRGAFQAESQEEFKSRMQEAVAAYQEAAEPYENVEHAKGLHCRAMALYANSWIQVEASRKKLVLDDCIELLEEAMKALEEAKDRLCYGKACNDLLFCLYDRWYLEWDWNEKKRCLEEAIRLGQNAISTLSKVGDERERARAYIIAGWHSIWAGVGYLGEEKREKSAKIALSYAEKALELSRKTGDAYLMSWSNTVAAWTQYWLTGNLELSLRHAEESLQQAEKAKDSFLVGHARRTLAHDVFWIMNAEEDPDKKREGYETVREHTEDGERHYLTICRYNPLVYHLRIESYSQLARDVETDPKEKRNLLEKAIKIGQKSLEHAEQSAKAYIDTVHHSLSKALYSLSKMETQITEKKRLLEEASEHREKSIDFLEQTASPFDYWNRGVLQNYAALIKAEFATIETNKEKKRRLLEEAVSHMERCIELCTKWTTIYPQAQLFAVLGWYYDWFGGILNQLYSLTKNEATLERATKVYQHTAETYRKAELPSRIAEAHWHVARLYDQLGEHTKSEHDFRSAAENYKLAAEKIPQLKEFYTNHALYVQAWSEIGKAKHHHAKRQYGQATEHYKKAADLHRSTEHWKYLSSNYRAWAKLEEAEDLSRQEQGEEATQAFKQATDLFRKAKTSIKSELKNIQDTDEQKMAAELIKASDLRHEYCQGRIALEEAKILDRQGDHAASSRKYGSAAEKFQKATDAMEHESDRQELRPIVYLCRAWQMMTRAEAEASPDLYLEASRLFEEVKEHSVTEKARELALGHSSFCKALEAGTRFEAMRDMTLYSTAKKHLEAAANYYLKEGFRNASEYAKATQRLFDAYMYMHKADTETDLKKKAELYRIAEKFLQASAGSYMKAKHPEKSEEVQRLLESVREEQQLAMSLTEVLHAPTATSTTTSFSIPTPTHEQAVGLERFEHADIQANLILRAKEVTVGEDVSLAIELVNAGKAPALLIKVDEVVPEGFDIKEVPETYVVEGSFINMKGKRLNPLKTEDVKIIVKPRSKGSFIVKPRVLYIDETGKYKSHEPEPIAITVKELGIAGWIKGEK